MSAIEDLLSGNVMCLCGHALKAHSSFTDHDECEDCLEDERREPCSEFRRDGDVRMRATAELRALQERVEAQQKMLKRLEWETSPANEMIAVCRICGAYGEIPEHRPFCELAALLKERT